jgi:hypothetical protein
MTTNPHYACNKMRAFAWAKYYESVNARHTSDVVNYTRTQTVLNEGTIPEHIKAEILAMGTELKKTWECPVCMEMIQPNNLDITNCGHYFCKPCLATYRQTNVEECKCPICRRKISG